MPREGFLIRNHKHAVKTHQLFFRNKNRIEAGCLAFAAGNNQAYACGNRHFGGDCHIFGRFGYFVSVCVGDIYIINRQDSYCDFLLGIQPNGWMLKKYIH